MMCRWQGFEATGNGDSDGVCILEAASYIRSTRSTAGYNFAARLDGEKQAQQPSIPVLAAAVWRTRVWGRDMWCHPQEVSRSHRYRYLVVHMDPSLDHVSTSALFPTFPQPSIVCSPPRIIKPFVSISCPFPTPLCIPGTHQHSTCYPRGSRTFFLLSHNTPGPSTALPPPFPDLPIPSRKIPAPRAPTPGKSK